MKQSIGFIGLGHMGIRMANRLLEAGFPLTVYNRSANKAAKLVDRGAKLAACPAALAECDTVITMLADDPAVEGVVTGPEGFAPTLKKGAIHIAMSTISVALSRRLAEQHKAASQHYVAAPVLGRPDAAEAGKLFILAAGEKVAECEPLFSAMGQRTFPIQGDAWNAHLTKLGCNFLIASAIEAMAEAFALTRKGGIDPAAFLNILTSTIFTAPAYKNYGGMIAAGKYQSEAGFTMPLAAKDVRLVLAAAEELRVPMPTASTVCDQMMQALGRGMDHLDWSALGLIAADNSGLPRAKE